MSTTDRACAAAHLPMWREAVRILHLMIDGIQGVTPMPDGRVSFAFEGEATLLERLCVWGAEFEDDEADDQDDEHDERDMPRLAADGVSLLPVKPGREIARLYESPADLVALAERIAA